MTTNKDIESVGKTIEQLAEELAHWICPSPIRGDISLREVRDLLIEFAREVKREAIEP